MKLTSFLSRSNETQTTSGLAEALVRGSRIVRSIPPIGPRQNQRKRFPEPPPLGTDDGYSMSVEAAYLMVGDRYDPRHLTPNEMVDMTELMLACRAIDRSDQSILLKGPKGKGYPVTDAGVARNFIGDWQDFLADSVGRSNLPGVTRATRALGILGRVAVTRLPNEL